MCTNIILKTLDGNHIYGRTFEWGLSDIEAELVVVPRNYNLTSNIADGIHGISWKNKYGFVAINFMHSSLYLDGMNEEGLTVGNYYFPYFTKFQELKKGEEAKSLNAADLISYILGNFKTVKEIRDKLPEINIVENKDNVKITGAPFTVHFAATDKLGKSIVIEYIDGKLNIHNHIGALSNSPDYEWQLKNLRNYTLLTPYASGPGEKEINGTNFTPFGAGAGMMGLPGDYSPVSRFIRAFFYVQTSSPMKDTETAINQAACILNNFDIPKGITRAGTPDNYSLCFTQWSSIADVCNRRYYWWTKWNRQLQMVDLSRLYFKDSKITAIPLDKTRKESIEDRTVEIDNICLS